MKTIEEAIISKNVWRSEIIDKYCTHLLLAALDLLANGTSYFNNDDVPDAHQPHDKTTVGAAIKQLLMVKIIQPWHCNVEDKDIWGGMRRSTRECCNGHRNQLYALTNEGMAREWLSRHQVKTVPIQTELAYVP